MGVLRSDARIVESGRDRRSFQDLPTSSCIRALRMPCNLRYLPRCQLGVNCLVDIGELAGESFKLGGDVASINPMMKLAKLINF